MAALTVDQLVTVRRRVGRQPVDAEIQTIYDRTGSLTETVREILEIRVADLRANPTSFTVPGEYSQDTAGQIKAIDAALLSLGDLDNEATEDDAVELPTVVIHHATRRGR